jgi:DNA polymerase-3 subunit epsilon
MDIDRATKVLEAHADYRLLRRLHIGDAHIFADNGSGEPCGRLAVIDTETTGLKAELGDRIIDLAIATCEYGRDSGRLYRVVDRYESLEDPETPIPPEITRLTGITDAMVRGQRIDEAGVARVMDRVGLVICHNARFDRAFLEARYPTFADRHFACSLDEVPWDQWNMKGSKLDYLGFRFGLFHEGHRARADVDLLLALLAHTVPEGDEGILSVLLASARAPSWRVHAVDLPIANKDYAAARGYRWNDGKFSTAERAFLAGIGCKRPIVVRQTARERYRSLAARSATEADQGMADGLADHR